MSEKSRAEKVQIAGALPAGGDDWVVSTRCEWRDGVRVSESASQRRVLFYLAARVWLREPANSEPGFYLVPLTSIASDEEPLEGNVADWVGEPTAPTRVVRGKVRLEKELLFEGRCGCHPTGDDTHMQVEHRQECMEAQRAARQ